MIVNFYGLKSIQEAIKNGYKLVNLYCTNIYAIPNDIPKEKISPRPRDFFNKYGDVNHQFFVGEFDVEIKEYDVNKAVNEFSNQELQTVLILDEIEDPRNFGAILRNALAFNVDLVIYKSDNQTQLNDLVIKTSLGAAHQLRLCKVPNISNAIDKLKKHGFWIYATTLADDSLDMNTINFDKKCAIIIGNENKGVSPLVIKNSDFKVKIKMKDKVQSLNVSVASGILLQKIYSQE